MTETRKAKLAYLTNVGPSALFFQCEDGDILIIEVTPGQIAGIISDGVKRLISQKLEHDADEYPAPSASAPNPTPGPGADALFSKART